MATYCVLLRAPQAGRAVRFYLRANSADRAFAAAMQENPELRALGIEMVGNTLSAQNQPHAA
jgi:hypothetical protein